MRGLQHLRLSRDLPALPNTPGAISRALLAFFTITDNSAAQSRHFGSYTGTGRGNGDGSGSSVTRDWLARIWKQEIKQWKEQRPKIRMSKGGGVGEGESEGLFGASASSTFQLPFLNWGAADNKDVSGTTTTMTSSSTISTGGQSKAGAVSVERKLASLLRRANLVVARDIEWANVLFAFEQESRYIIMDASSSQSPVGYIHETSNVIFRQLLRTRRPFTAQIIDFNGNEIFRVRRPFWLINSTIYAEVDGKEIGVVHRRWHLWRRIYDLYLGNKQFAVVENPGFWNWTFTLKDEDDNVLAQIDRNWRGIGLELFTDAGQYVIRFGDSLSVYHDGSGDHIEKFEVARPLTLPERAIALALAVSLDCDYFSRRGGWGLPIMILEE